MNESIQPSEETWQCVLCGAKWFIPYTKPDMTTDALINRMLANKHHPRNPCNRGDRYDHEGWRDGVQYHLRWQPERP